MNLQETKYDAFISYRHTELDQFVAVNLHKELEAFKLPKAIRKQLQAKGIDKKKIDICLDNLNSILKKYDIDEVKWNIHESDYLNSFQ